MENEELTNRLNEVLEECEARMQALDEKDAEINDFSNRVQELEEALGESAEQTKQLQDELAERKINSLNEFNQEDKQQIIEEFQNIQDENEQLKSHLENLEKERIEKDEGFQALINQYEEQLSEIQNENQTLAEALTSVKPGMFKEGQENDNGEEQPMNAEE